MTNVKPPSNAKTTVQRSTRPGSIRTVRLRLWWAIQEASVLLDDDEKEIKLKAISAISTASGVYAKLTESSEMMKQIESLQRELKQLKETSPAVTPGHQSITLSTSN